MLALTLANYKWAVSLSFLLLGLQVIEPAPVDFAVIIAVAIVTGRMDLRAAPLWVLVRSAPSSRSTCSRASRRSTPAARRSS